MANAEELAEYVGNLRALLNQSEARFAIMVERQVQFALLPKLAGPKSSLESPLWDLLVLLLDGHQAPVESPTDPLWTRALDAAQQGASLSMADGKARFPKAAQAVAGVAATLRDCGVYPAPRLPPSKAVAPQ